LIEHTVADEREFSIATIRPTLRQRRLAYAVVAILAIDRKALEASRYLVLEVAKLAT